MSLILSSIGLAATAATGIAGFFSSKKKQEALEEQAQAQLDYDLDYADNLYDQRASEIEKVEAQADSAIGTQKAQQGANGAGNEGSALLASMTSEINKGAALGSLTTSAEDERTNTQKQAYLNYDATIAQAEAEKINGYSSLLTTVASTAKLGAEVAGEVGLFGDEDIDTTLTESAVAQSNATTSSSSQSNIHWTDVYDVTNDSNTGHSSLFTEELE